MPKIQAPDPSKMGMDIKPTVKAETLQSEVQKLKESAMSAIANTDIADPLLAQFRAVFVDSNTLGNLMKTAIDNGIAGLSPDFASLQEQVARGMDIPDEKFRELESKINEQLLTMGIEPVRIDFATGKIKTLIKDGNDITATYIKAANAVSSVGTALQAIENPVAKVSGIIAQAIATIALTFAQSLKGTFTPWDWIAGAAAGAATMISTIAAVKSATAGSYAEGGIIPGNSFSGDNLTANVNSGELILSMAQQNSIAGQLQTEQRSVPGRSSVSISSETIRIVLHNGTQSRGMSVGEYLEL